MSLESCNILQQLSTHFPSTLTNPNILKLCLVMNAYQLFRCKHPSRGQNNDKENNHCIFQLTPWTQNQRRCLYIPISYYLERFFGVALCRHSKFIDRITNIWSQISDRSVAGCISMPATNQHKQLFRHQQKPVYRAVLILSLLALSLDLFDLIASRYIYNLLSVISTQTDRLLNSHLENLRAVFKKQTPSERVIDQQH